MAILLRDTAFGRILRRLTNKPTHLNHHRAAADADIHPSKDGLVPEAVYLVDWTGPTDEDNPRNWPSWLKVLVLCNVLIVNLSFYTAPGIYSASITSIQESLGASYEVAILGLSLFVIAYGVGPLIVSWPYWPIDPSLALLITSTLCPVVAHFESPGHRSHPGLRVWLTGLLPI